MSNNTLPVIAAVPNYNMATSLQELLPQLAAQDYAGIYVLDDASTDESREVVESFETRINFVPGHENLGAGGNRNRIMGAIGHKAIIHFIDADMHLETDNVPELAQDLMGSDAIGFVGGLIKDLGGRQLPFNYGPRQCLRADIGANIQSYIYSKLDSDPAGAAEVRQRFHRFVADYPDLQAEPAPRQVFWNAESNLLIRSDVLEAVGGFDTTLRDHEIQDLAIRLSEMGAERRFDPLLSAVHEAVLVRSGNRRLQMVKAELQIASKHGYRNWLFPNGSFEPVL